MSLKKMCIVLTLIVCINVLGGCGILSLNSTTSMGYTLSLPSVGEEGYMAEYDMSMAVYEKNMKYNGKLKMSSGIVDIVIINSENGEVAWSGHYEESENFTIELGEVEAGDKFKMTVDVETAKNLQLEVRHTELMVEYIIKKIVER